MQHMLLASTPLIVLRHAAVNISHKKLKLEKFKRKNQSCWKGNIGYFLRNTRFYRKKIFHNALAFKICKLVYHYVYFIHRIRLSETQKLRRHPWSTFLSLLQRETQTV